MLPSSVIPGDNYGHPRGQIPALGTDQNPTLALLQVPAGCAGREDPAASGHWRAVAFSSDSSPSVINSGVSSG